MRITATQLKTLVIALVGAVVFKALHVPLPFLFGPMFFCLIAALGRVQLRSMGPWAAAARTILGVAVGASITPDVIRQLPQTGLSLAFVPLYVALIGLIGMPFFRRVAGFDRPTAFFSSMPGGLQDVLVLGIEAGANARQLSLVQATRVLIIVTLAPIVLSQVYGASLRNPVGLPATQIPLHEMALMAVAAYGGWKLAERVGLFGATILGPMIATIALSLAGLIHHRPPAEAILLAQFFIGMTVGVQYNGITVRELGRTVAFGVVFMVLLAGLAVVFSELVVLLGLAPPLDAFLAYAPGGQSEMTVLAIVTGADLGFIIVHHLLRMTLVIVSMPIVSGLLRLKDAPKGDGAGRHKEIAGKASKNAPDQGEDKDL